MAGVPNILILAVLLLNTLINVHCDKGTSTSQQVEDCKNVCRNNFQDRLELNSCVNKCVAPSVPENKGNGDECLKGCMLKNPEGAALCELKCQNLPQEKKPQDGSAVSSDFPSDALDVDTARLFSNIHSRVSKMMDCLMDGMRHQVNYGWASMPNMMDARMDKFMEDANQFFKEQNPSELLPEGKAPSNLNGHDVKIVGKEEKPKGEVVPSFSPVFHRLIIIKKIPYFYEENEEAEKEADLDMSDSMAARLKNLVKNFFGTIESTGRRDAVEKSAGDVGSMKSASLSGESEKKSSNGKFCDFLSNLAHKSGLKRTTFVLLVVVVLLCVAWYCIATIINSKHKELRQEQLQKVTKENLEYLVPIEDKFIFFAHLDGKEKPGDVVQAPSIPIKIRVEDV